MLGEPPGSPRPSPLVRFADKALRAFPEGGRFAAAALVFTSGLSVCVGRGDLLDPELRSLEALDAGAIELFALAKESDCIVDGDVAALEASDDLFQLPLQLLEAALAHLAGVSSRVGEPGSADA
jgi:hypothetical protein